MALVVAMAMTLAMAGVAFGATISTGADDTHTYKVFQVLTGTQANAGDQNLGNPAWGDDATSTAKAGSVSDFIDEITAPGLSESQIAEFVAAKIDTTADGRGTVTKDRALADLATGYYVLVDVTNPLNEGDSLSLHLVKVVNDVEITPKKDSVPSDKKITTDTLGAGSTTVDGTADNVSIGDTVNFEISGTVPQTAKNYDYYFFILNDTLSEGLTLDPESINVYKVDTTAANKLTTADYKVYTGTDEEDAPTYAGGKTFQVALLDAKAHAGEKIIVTYGAKLNENAKIGETSNPNNFTITYSNDPNHKYNGDKGNDTPGKPDSTKTVPTNDTVQKTTDTYTTGIEIQKVDENGNVLTGAEFTISGESTEIVLVSEESFEEATDGEYYKLANNNYTKDALVAADRMIAAAEGATSGYVVDPDYEGDGAVTIDSVTYRPYNASSDTEAEVFTLEKANADLYANDSKRYKKTVTYTSKNTKTTGVTAAAEVGDDGVVRFVGLGEGTYTITETKTPAGYNTLDPLSVTIKFDSAATPKWSKTSGNATYDQAEGVFKMEIENNKGTELPSTGGMGTTLLYAAGGILVVGAGVALVARRRAASER